MFSSVLAFFQKLKEKNNSPPDAKILFERAMSQTTPIEQLLSSKPEYKRAYQLFPQDVITILKLEFTFNALLNIIEKGHIEIAEVKYINNANEKLMEVHPELKEAKKLLSKKINFVENVLLPAFGSIQLTAEVDMLIQHLLQAWECKLETLSEIQDKISELLLMQLMERDELKEAIEFEKQECSRKYKELKPLHVKPKLNEMGWLVPYEKLPYKELKKRERQFNKCQNEIRIKEIEVKSVEKKLADFERLLVFPEGSGEAKEPTYHMVNLPDYFKSRRL
ncbi:MAG: hypothetical protein ACYCQI_04720 [Gammaproteobacteria bacterium]